MPRHDLKIFRRFMLYRKEDECGVSGTGTIAEGAQFSTGKCVLSWLSDVPSIEIYDSVDEIIRIHGHHGKTEIRWIDSV